MASSDTSVLLGLGIVLSIATCMHNTTNLIGLCQFNLWVSIIDNRHGSSSTLMISQLPTDQWYESIGDNTLADAILDRLMHNAHRVELKGETMRKLQSIID